jgi:hypothetical protein
MGRSASGACGGEVTSGEEDRGWDDCRWVSEFARVLGRVQARGPSAEPMVRGRCARSQPGLGLRALASGRG